MDRHGHRTYQPQGFRQMRHCPVSHLPITRRQEWTDVTFGPNFRQSVCFIGPHIVFSQPCGYADRLGLEQSVQLTRDAVAAFADDSAPVVLVMDYADLVGSTMEARRRFIELTKAYQRYTAIVVCNASAPVRISIALARRLNVFDTPIHVVDDYRAAICQARAILASDSAAPAADDTDATSDPERCGEADRAPAGRSGTISDPAWRYSDGQFEVRYELIDHHILHSRARGRLDKKHIQVIDHLREQVIGSCQPAPAIDCILSDMSRISAASHGARLGYLNSVKSFHQDHPFEIMVIYGANAFIQTAMALVEPLLPFQVKTAADFSAAMKLAAGPQKQHRGSLDGQRSPGRTDAGTPSADRYAAELLHILGQIDWENGRTNVDAAVSETHPFFQVVEAIKLIKDEIDELIEEQRHTERRLSATAKRYRELFQQAPLMYVVTRNEDGQPLIADVNDTVTATLGYRREEMIDMPLADFYSSASRYALIEGGGYQRALDGTFSEEERTLIACDGRRIDTVLHALPETDDNGKVVGSRAMFVDITERKMAEEQKARLERQLRQSSKLEAIGTLAGGIAHDFNNILASIIGYTELAIDDAPEDSLQHENLKEVFKAGTRARDLVRQILAFARQSEGQRRPVLIGPIVAEVAKLLRATAPAGIEIRQHIDTQTPVMADASQIHQVILNLCTNAVQAMERSGGLLSVCLSAIDAAECPDDMPPLPDDRPCLVLQVHDTGDGIAKDQLDAVFDPYYSTKDPGRGTGLGLSVVHGIVNRHGGQIQVDSSPGQGTTVTVWFPAATEAITEIDAVDGRLPRGDASVLVVDDEAAVAKMVSRQLVSLGYTVEQETSSTSALARVTARPADFDLVITDMAMPRMNGDSLAKQLLAVRPDLPIILATGYSNKISPEKAAAIGIRHVMTKPVIKRELAATVYRILNGDTP